MSTISRRDFVRTCVLGSAALASHGAWAAPIGSFEDAKGLAAFSIPLVNNWLFGGKYQDGAEQSGFNDSAFVKVTLPHCVTSLSWENWKPESWQDVWIYRRHFQMPEKSKSHRIFLDFDRVMNHAKPSLNGHALPEHLGGYLPFSYEVTELLKEGDNVLSVIVDSRWQKIPPDGNPKGTQTVDYLEPGGIPGGVRLRVLPQVFISDVFAKPVNVLSADRSVEVTCSIDAAASLAALSVRVEMLDGEKRIAATEPLKLEKADLSKIKITLGNLGNVKLWDLDAPHLYTIVTTVLLNGKPADEHRTRIGLREAKFTNDGFFLNGRRMQLFGLNRHEVYPYTGMAVPGRVTRRDAEILKHEFNCNIVRCSHYPQTETFLDACDELGLMVWEEPPGWGYLGDDAWKEIVVQNVHDMVVRDRNHPAIVIWGVRVNESKNDPPLYERTTKLAKELDGTRACSGSMTSRKARETGWNEDVFAMDDYHNAPDGSVGISAPLPGIPYMLAETVGGFSYGSKGFSNKYRRAGDLAIQTAQAIYHAEAHDRAAAFPGFCGVIAWCGFDYASLLNCYNAVKCPGVADVFRIPKLGAAFYQSQVSPKVRPVILPAFYWDFGAKSPRGPGRKAAIFSNCDRLEIFVGGKHFATAQPDREKFKHLEYPPFFCDLDFESGAPGELRIEGYVGDHRALSKSFSPDAAHDQLLLQADDDELIGDGADATRVVFKVADQFGNERAFASGTISFEITGPGVIVGDNPFDLTDSGGVGAVWIKTVPGGSGGIKLQATHSTLGKKSVQVRVLRESTRDTA
jgi:beta-galactosidase